MDCMQPAASMHNADPVQHMPACLVHESAGPTRRAGKAGRVGRESSARQAAATGRGASRARAQRSTHTYARAHLLVAALHGAVALVQVHHVAVVVRQDLDLNVPRVLLRGGATRVWGQVHRMSSY